MNIPAEIFRAYDIRGIAGKVLSTAVVRDIGRALGTLARERGSPAFAVGRDGRLSGPELSTALMDGLNAAGADVFELGVVPTPVTYFAAHHLGCGSAVMVTGSHNPGEYNGLKMVIGGDTLSGEEIQDLRRRIEVRFRQRQAAFGKRPRRLRRAHRRRRQARAAVQGGDRLRQWRRRRNRAAPVPPPGM